MSIKSNIFIKCLGLLFFFNLLTVNAQMLRDTACLNLIKKDIGYTYNLQFDIAGDVFKQISQLYPEHPIVFLLRGIMTYWENYPLIHLNPSHISFEKDMRQCIYLSESNKDPAYETEYLLADMCARGMLLMFYADNDLSLEVIPIATSTYKYLKRSFYFSESCIDLNYFTGLYNYYREAYPSIYPIYKSLAFIFPAGDMENGLKQLQTTAVNSVLLSAESYFSLAWINLYYENNYPESLSYSRILHELYPENREYLALYIKNLLLMKKYDEAEVLVSASSEEAKTYYQAQVMIFKGILHEKKYQGYTLAQEFYNNGIVDIAFFGDYGNEYAAYAYYGLSRINEANGEKEASKIYRKKASKLADFKKINFDN